MPELNIVRRYEDGEALLESDLDNIKNAVTDLNNTTLYDGDNIQPLTITSSKIVDGTISATQLGTGSVTSNKLNDSALTTAKILDGEIETRTIADSAVTTAKIADANVTTAKFSTAARLSSSKIAARVVLNASNSSPTVSTGSAETVVTATAVADMKRCLIMLQPYDSSAAYVELTKDYGYTNREVFALVSFLKNGSTMGTLNMRLGFSDTYRGYLRVPISAFSYIMAETSPSSISTGDEISVTITWSFLGAVGVTGSATVSACKLYIIEL